MKCRNSLVIMLGLSLLAGQAYAQPVVQQVAPLPQQQRYEIMTYDQRVPQQQAATMYYWPTSRTTVMQNPQQVTAEQRAKEEAMRQQLMRFSSAL